MVTLRLGIEVMDGLIERVDMVLLLIVQIAHREERKLKGRADSEVCDSINEHAPTLPMALSLTKEDTTIAAAIRAKENQNM